MSWIDFMRIYSPGINEESANYILMCETAFPFSDIRMTTYQIRSAIRAGKNKISRCELCGNKLPFHSRGCIAI